MPILDFSAPAEIFSKSKTIGGIRTPVKYHRFDSLSLALQFAMEEYAANLNSISIHAGDFEYTGNSIRSLYEGEGYPLPRTSAHSDDAGHGPLSASRAPRTKSHKFKLGDTVVFRHAGLKRPGGVYEVVRILPTEKAEPSYRIKSKTEQHERAVEEHEISMA